MTIKVTKCLPDVVERLRDSLTFRLSDLIKSLTFLWTIFFLVFMKPLTTNFVAPLQHISNSKLMYKNYFAFYEVILEFYVFFQVLFHLLFKQLLLPSKHKILSEIFNNLMPVFRLHNNLYEFKTHSHKYKRSFYISQKKLRL